MDAHEQAGWKIGRYELRELLGRGGFGTVYRAYDTRLEVERAVKILHPILNSSPEYITRFTREARLVARMDHPNIVPVYDFDHDSARHFLVMKYMAGGSLSGLIKEGGPLPFKRMLAILRDATAALDYAHGQGLVHRDVKPANVLFEARDAEQLGAARLGDFGFARALTGEEISSLSLSGGLLGTPAYMAPELWRNRPATPSSDVYSLGCLATEMLTGQVLFAGDSPAEIMTSHVLDGPRFPEPWPGEIPPGLEGVLRKALERKPEDRFSSAAEFFQALRGLAGTQAALKDSAPVLPPREPADSVERWRAETHSALRSGDDARVETALARWLALAPNDPEAIALQVEQARRRVEQGEKGRLRRALGDVRQAAEERVAVPAADSGNALPTERAAPPPAASQPMPVGQSVPPARHYPRAEASAPSSAPARPKTSRKWIFPGMAFAGVALMALCVAGVALYGSAINRSADQTQVAMGAVSPVGAIATTQVMVGEQVSTATPSSYTSPPEGTPAPNGEKNTTLSPADAKAAIATLSVLQDLARTALAEQVLAQQANPEVGFTPNGNTEVLMLETARSTWPWVALDNFDTNANGWTETSVKDNWGVRTFFFQDGLYLIDAESFIPSSFWAFNDVGTVQDFYVSLDVNIVHTSSVSAPASAGLILRETGAGYYKFEISPSGYFLMGYQDTISGAWNNIYPWQFSDAIHSGGNQLAVIAQGSDMWLYINGAFVGGVMDAYITEGSVAPILSLYTASDTASAAYDNFELRVP